MKTIRHAHLAAVLGATLALLGCGGVSTQGDGGSVVDSGGGADAMPRVLKLDVLFVIDNSGTMAQEQEALARAFPQFVTALEGMPGGVPSLHIGVVTSDVGVGPYVVPNCSMIGGGVLVNTPSVEGCSAPTDRYLIDEPGPAGGPRVTNYPGTLAETFACIARVGDRGCGFEQHLGAMRLALASTTVENAGFLRADAKLAVVIIADEDDCSASDTSLFDPASFDLGPLSSFRCTQYGVECGGLPVTSTPASYADCKASSTSTYLTHTRAFANDLRALKANPGDVLFAAVVGDPAPFVVGNPSGVQNELLSSCASVLGTAVPGARFDSMAAEFGENGFRASICADDLGPALQGVAAFVVSQL